MAVSRVVTQRNGHTIHFGGGIQYNTVVVDMTREEKKMLLVWGEKVGRSATEQGTTESD
jgi:hypothetical protein